MTSSDKTTVLAQLRALHQLTNTEAQVAETRIVQARTEAVQRELTQNASNARERSQATRPEAKLHRKLPIKRPA